MWYERKHDKQGDEMENGEVDVSFMKNETN